MHKLYSETIGQPVFTEYSKSPVALIQDLVIDPENGKILAFVVKKKYIIVPMDVEKFSNGLYISDSDKIIPVDDVLRVQEVLKRGIKIIGNKVVTEKTKVHIGQVADYEIDTTHMVLSSIHAARMFLFFRLEERIIPFHSIVKINKESIIVKNASVVAKAESKEETVSSSAYAA